jgi:hypothetical protein
MTPVKIVSLVFQIALLVGMNYLPPVYPARIQKVLGTAISGVALVFTTLNIPLYPAALPIGPIELGVGLVFLALLSPVAGLIESRGGKNGQAVYSTGVIPGTPNRLPGHLLSNVMGALATAAIVWGARSSVDLPAFDVQFPDDAAFNIVLPLATLTVLSFARWQQVTACPDIDERARRGPDPDEGIVGYSLGHWHQLANILYLIGAFFTAMTAVLYMFAFSMEQAKAGRPLPTSWQAIVAILLVLGFFFVCGGPWSREHEAVYLAFLTGTPAVLSAALIWLSWFQNSTFRNIAALSITGLGYLVYCVEVVLHNRARGDRLQLNYFTVASVAIVLVTLLGALYLS